MKKFNIFKNKKEILINPNGEITANEQKESEEINFYFEKLVHPKTRFKQTERYIQNGFGYETCLVSYKFPLYPDLFWLNEIFNTPGIIPKLSIESIEQTTTIRKIGSSISEHRSRLGKVRAEEELDSEMSIQNLEELHQSLKTGGDALRSITLRVYVYGETLEVLQEKISEVKEVFSSQNIEISFDDDNQGHHYEARTSFQNMQGNVIDTYSLATSVPFGYSQINDPKGFYFGLSQSGGIVAIDFTEKNLKQGRKSFNITLLGDMGSGKSATAKKIVLNETLSGHTTFIIDVEGEYKTLTQKLGGVVIAADGTQGSINPLQISETVEVHIGNLYTFIKGLLRDISEEEIEVFISTVRKLYEMKGITNENLHQKKNSEFPILSDVVKLLKETKSTDDEVGVRLQQNLIRRLTHNIENYGLLFNTHTTFDTDIHLVCIDIKNLRSMKDVFNAQVFNIFNVFLLSKMNKNKALNEERRIKNEPYVFTRVILDEAHVLLNTQNAVIVDILSFFSRQARKYYGGIILAIQSLNQVFLGTSSETSTQIEEVFNLSQYKIILQQPSQANKDLLRVFGLNENELHIVNTSNVGEMLLQFGEQQIKCKLDLSEIEKNLFHTGV